MKEEGGSEVHVVAYKSRETDRCMQIMSVSDNVKRVAVEYRSRQTTGNRMQIM